MIYLTLIPVVLLATGMLLRRLSTSSLTTKTRGLNGWPSRTMTTWNPDTKWIDRHPFSVDAEAHPHQHALTP